MTKILTASQVKTIAVVDPNLDESYFDKLIEYTQLVDLKPIMTKELFDDFLAKIGSLPTNYQILFDNYIQYIVAYGTYHNAIKKDIAFQVSNQGVMGNRTDFSESDKNNATRIQLLTIRDITFTYQFDLGCYLIENKDDFPLFDIDKINLEFNFNGFFGL